MLAAIVESSNPSVRHARYAINTPTQRKATNLTIDSNAIAIIIPR
ncbi:Uncharacterised protein [Vibrio cholerae]|nr:Uncharacterised protein [Vibrio cholerae]CSI29476.1 Uncharacterised protein [Vibrio cholerae]CSI53979.1 Uncharacterised protein [Vibrio cholerae]